MKKYYVGLIILILITLICLSTWDTLQVWYIHLFKKSAYIEHLDKNGKRQGDFIAYLNGAIYIKLSFKNGVKDGLYVKYYSNGNVQDRVSYMQGKANGLEENFYSNGVLNYSTNWCNGIEYGSEFHYTNYNAIINYDAFDLENVFCYVTYKLQKRWQILGSVISPNIYSLDKSHNSKLKLQNKGNYQNITDLYVPIATPPFLSTSYKIKVNDNKINGLKISQNTLVVKNIFKNSGIYQIFILGEFKDASGKSIKKDSINMSINIIK